MLTTFYNVCLFITIFIILPFDLQATEPVTQAKKIIKIAHPNVPNHPMGKGFYLFKEDLEKRSNGHFDVQVYDNSSYGNFVDVMNGLFIGVLQMGSHSTSNFSVYNPNLMVLDVPFLIPSYEASDLITDGPIGKSFADELSKDKLHILGYIEIGFRNIFSSRPIRTLEDAKGLKIRATASKAHNTLLDSLGMEPKTVSWENAYRVLRDGNVDAIDIDLNLAYYNRFPEITKYVTMTRSIYSPHLVMMSQIFWNKLSDQEKKWIEESFKVMQEYERNEIRKNEEIIIEKIKKMGGEIIELSPEEKQRWLEASQQAVINEFPDAIPLEMVEAIRETVKSK